MNRLVNRLYRLVQDLAGIEDPPQTRLSREEAIELARAAAERAGIDLGGAAIGAAPVREGKARQVVWDVVVSVAGACYDAVYARVKIDDATGDVIEVGSRRA